ncbi:MAG: hypothetical protein Q9227_003300 [Pyrenula ochraceoflavens]
MSGASGNTPIKPKPESRSPFLSRRFPALAAGGLVLTGLYMYLQRNPNPIKTKEVSNIESRFAAGGGKPTHTPAFGGSAQSTNVVQRGGKGNGAVGKEVFQTEEGGKGGEEQRPTESGFVGKSMNQMSYGNKDGK